MKCIGCGSDDAITALIEIFPCKHCNKEMRMEYNVCRCCGITWKSLDGEFFSNATIFDMELGNFFSGEEAERSFSEPSENIESEVYMGDYVHRCLRCNALCYEEKEGMYVCPECDFQWEVISG